MENNHYYNYVSKIGINRILIYNDEYTRSYYIDIGTYLLIGLTTTKIREYNINISPFVELYLKFKINE